MRLTLAWTVLLGWAAVSPGAAAEVLLQDDFSAPRPGWSVGEVVSIRDQQLFVTLGPNLVHRNLYKDQQFTDADIRLRIRQDAGNDDQPGGIVFWAEDHDNFYVARIHADGAFAVVRRTRGRYLTPLGSRVRPEMNRGVGQENELRVVTRGSSATFFINGQEAAALQGYPPSEPSRIGLYAESGAEPTVWSFSQLLVTRPAPAPSPPTAPRDALLRADFTGRDAAWGVASDVKSFRDGRLTINLQPKLLHRTLYQGRLFDEVDLTAKVTLRQGGTNRFAGIVFWAKGPRDYCAILVQGDGKQYVGQYINGEWKHLNSLNNDALIRQGVGQTNELRVVTHQNKADIYLNGKSVAKFTGFPPEGGSLIGIHAESGAEAYMWEFSDYVVREPAPPTAAK